MFFRTGLNLRKWIEENRQLLKPPVANKVIWDDAEMIVMVVAGPNSRKDYHVNEGEEFFYQIEGNIILKIIEEGKSVDVSISEGEVYLLRSRIPHCPQRPAHTVGLVIEMPRVGHELDGFQWYCEKCHQKMHEEFVEITDIGKQLPEIFAKFYGNPINLRCRNCGWVMEPPDGEGVHG